MNTSNFDLAYANCLENAANKVAKETSGFPQELVKAHLKLQLDSLEHIKTHLYSLNVDDPYSAQLLKLLNCDQTSLAEKNIELLAQSIPLENLQRGTSNTIDLILFHEQEKILSLDTKLGHKTERLAHLKVVGEELGLKFDVREFVEFCKSKEILKPQEFEETIGEYLNNKNGSGLDIPEPMTRQSFWESKIKRSLVYDQINPEKQKTFIDTLINLESEFSRPPEFYINIFCSNGIAASKAGALVKLINGEPTGFYNPESHRKEGTVGDMVREALLEVLPSNLNDSAEFGINFEFAAKHAFETQYQKEHGVKLKSILTPKMRKALNRCTNVYPFKVGLDELYIDEKNDKLILPEFKLPSLLNGSNESASQTLDLLDDHRYQTVIYQEAVYFVTGRVPDEAIVYQFGMDGMKDLLPLIKDESTKTQIKTIVQEKITHGFTTGTEHLRFKKNFIGRDLVLLNDVLIPAADHFIDGYLKPGIIPEEPDVNKEQVSEEMVSTQKAFAQYALNTEFKDQVAEQNKRILQRISEIKEQLDVDVIKGLCASTSKRSSQPAASVLYERALKAGLKIDMEDVSDVIVKENKKVDPVKLEAICKKNHVSITNFRTSTFRIKKNTDYHFTSNLKPKLESLASQVVNQSQKLSEAMEDKVKVEVNLTTSVKEENAPSVEDLGYANAPSM